MPDKFTADKTRVLKVEQEAPHGETRTLTYVVRAGVEYTIVPDSKLGTLPVSQTRNEISESAVPDPDATDNARELAEEEGVRLISVDGTGKDGRVTKADVQRHIDS